MDKIQQGVLGRERGERRMRRVTGYSATGATVAAAVFAVVLAQSPAGAWPPSEPGATVGRLE